MKNDTAGAPEATPEAKKAMRRISIFGDQIKELGLSNAKMGDTVEFKVCAIESKDEEGGGKTVTRLELDTPEVESEEFEKKEHELMEDADEEMPEVEKKPKAGRGATISVKDTGLDVGY